nr:melanoma-associated antigen C3-like isoform X2 [Saimiri boliviensis boliviensis]
MPAFLRPRPLAGRRAPERRRRLPRGGRRWYFPASGERPGPQAPFSLPPRQPPRSALPQSPRRARAAPHPGTAAPKAGAAPSQSNEGSTEWCFPSCWHVLRRSTSKCQHLFRLPGRKLGQPPSQSSHFTDKELRTQKSK